MAVRRYALCLSNDFGSEFGGGDVFPGMAYVWLGDERGMVRIVDETGEDYLYPQAAFRLLSEEDSALLERSLARMAA